MLRSLFSGISGLRQHQTMMDVVGNNIANVNTVGYKSSSTVFEDTLSQMVRAAGGSSQGQGGVNPAQIGLGVQMGAIGTNFGQGSAQNTGKATDLMIQGDGFFVVKNGQEAQYTRAGDFNFDSDGSLVNSAGLKVQGWPATNGAVNSNGPIQDIVIPTGTLISPVASTKMTLGGNIPTSAATGDVVTFGATTYDVKGDSHDLTVTMTKTGANAWDVSVADASDPSSTATTGSVTFDNTGAVTVNTPPGVTFADGTSIGLDLSGLTQYGGPKSATVTAVDGAAAGTLQQFQITPDGTVMGMFSNGQRLPLATIALANFNNPNGLEKLGGSTYRSSANSGLPQVGTPSSGSRGSLVGGSLEMSNVDLAQEFTNLIIAQRGFQANSKVITTSDQMLQDLVNLKQ